MSLTPLPFAVQRLIDLALEEDLGPGDLTTQATIDPQLQAEAHMRAKEELFVAGLPVAAAVFHRLDAAISFHEQVHEGDQVPPGTILAIVTGPAGLLLSGERVALNFLMRLSGIATQTRRFVEAVQPYPVQLVDTRKTTPGWRVLEKYAVRLGGGTNHRFGLFDGVLIKDNHLVAAGSITAAVRRARRSVPHTLKIEVEVADLAGLEEAITAGADMVLLDNMDDATLAQAVKKTQDWVLLEASGGITLERLPQVAAAGVNLISVGALTHSARSVDISMKLVRTWM
ncbi:MAG: carboxylating nicotinate-nucleotide diphosphorylase [Deltaproteobacteria bacterium]|nr:carboxylating nicotinate-nucleotide diphosphorylase [Deltaproteobacteria bacterium]MBW1951861.1 carboxylating nicotinate-nucleotide diphosphorylase [Deltaproteobacteria bacterium]MBW1986559.1 carboxylating nicotinate-nucleotide diphosphorylase [Deltaproteobacteria bacterium]MBW2134513.1 carboxylating nicotinate-nucleotide diphosphorylase [Deltaproteobacteria bacterium]